MRRLKRRRDVAWAVAAIMADGSWVWREAPNECIGVTDLDEQGFGEIGVVKDLVVAEEITGTVVGVAFVGVTATAQCGPVTARLADGPERVVRGTFTIMAGDGPRRRRHRVPLLAPSRA